MDVDKGVEVKSLDELIKALQDVRTEHGGDLPIIYDGILSPVHGVTVLRIGQYHVRFVVLFGG